MDINRLKQIVNENVDLMIRKNQDYSGQSGDNITATGIYGVAVRLMDKITRLNNLLKSDSINYESVADTLNDISNYGLIGRMVEEGSWASLPKMVYLAGPVDGIPEEDALIWRAETAKALGLYGVNVYNPMGPYLYNTGDMRISAKEICEICRYAINKSDVVLVNLTGKGKAFGTIREIEYAKSIGKRVVVAGDVVSLFGYDVEIVGNLGEAIVKIVGEANINAGI